MTYYPKMSGPAQLGPESGIFRNDSSAKFPLGAVVWDVYGNAYRYVKANEAIAVGELVTAVALAAWDSTVVVDGAVTAGDTKIHVDTNTSAFTANQYAGYYIRQGEGSALGRLHRIASHAAIDASSEVDIILDESSPAQEAISDGTALQIFNPYLMELTDADTETIRGVGIGTITANYFGFVQVSGITNVLCDGSNGTAVVLNEPIVPYGTDPGQGQGCTENDATSDFEVANSPLIALDASTTDGGYVPAMFVRFV